MELSKNDFNNSTLTGKQCIPNKNLNEKKDITIQDFSDTREFYDWVYLLEESQSQKENTLPMEKVIQEKDPELLKLYQFTQFQKLADRSDIYFSDIVMYLQMQKPDFFDQLTYQHGACYKGYHTKEEFIKLLAYEDWYIQDLIQIFNQELNIEPKVLLEALAFAKEKANLRKQEQKVKQMIKKH